MHHSHHSLPTIVGQRIPNLRGETGICEEGEDEGECGCSKNSMVELDRGGVFKHVSPPEIGLVLFSRVERREKLGFGRGKAEAHAREFVIDKPGVETSY